MEISLCMIVKNEEEVLGRCLGCVKNFIDEIIIVDTGSNDRTKEIAEEFGAKVFDFKWCEDFAQARNYAFAQATKEYIMWLDADDYITSENIDKLIRLKAKLDTTIDAVSLHYSLSRDEKGETIYSLRRNRILRREKGFKWIGRIHECIEVEGNTIHEDIYIHHDKQSVHTDRNLKIFRLMQEKGEQFSTRDLLYFGNELYYNEFYEEAIVQYIAFLKTDGWIEDRKTAIANLLQCYTMTNEENRKMDTILESFKWGRPRADICCKMAEEFMRIASYKDAIFWYKIAMQCIPDEDNMGIDLKVYYTWIPAIQLCVCYSKLGEYYTAYYYNEVCASFGGDAEKVLHNRKFLTAKMEESGEMVPQFEKQLIDKRIK